MTSREDDLELAQIKDRYVAGITALDQWVRAEHQLVRTRHKGATDGGNSDYVNEMWALDAQFLIQNTALKQMMERDTQFLRLIRELAPETIPTPSERKHALQEMGILPTLEDLKSVLVQGQEETAATHDENEQRRKVAEWEAGRPPLAGPIMDKIAEREKNKPAQDDPPGEDSRSRDRFTQLGGLSEEE